MDAIPACLTRSPAVAKRFTDIVVRCGYLTHAAAHSAYPSPQIGR